MKCPNCNKEDSKVIDSRSIQGGGSIRRRRECIECEFRYTTYEYVLVNPIKVIYKSTYDYLTPNDLNIYGVDINALERLPDEEYISPLDQYALEMEALNKGGVNGGRRNKKKRKQTKKSKQKGGRKSTKKTKMQKGGKKSKRKSTKRINRKSKRKSRK